jgi:hypothetical protein
MVILVGLLGVIVVSAVVMALALRTVESELAVLRARMAKLVRLSVAVDDLHHETTQVVPAYRSAVTRARTLRRTDDREGGR